LPSVDPRLLQRLGWLGGLSGLYRQSGLGLQLEVAGQHALGDGRGGGSTGPAVLDDHGHCDLRIFGRCKGSEQGVIPVADRNLVVLQTLGDLEAHDLSGTRLPRYLYVRHA
jgi:hypothetical protein